MNERHGEQEMEEVVVRTDLAFLESAKGVLKLTYGELKFTPRKGMERAFSIPLNLIEELSFKKTSLETSKLYVNNLEITVCRAHLWASDIKTILARK